jgi:hypothetical protein
VITTTVSKSAVGLELGHWTGNPVQTEERGSPAGIVLESDFGDLIGSCGFGQELVAVSHEFDPGAQGHGSITRNGSVGAGMWPRY